MDKTEDEFVHVGQNNEEEFENIDELTALVKIRTAIEQTDLFIISLEKNNEWNVNTESIIAELKSFKNLFISIEQSIKSNVQQQMVHVNNIAKQLKILATIAEDANGKFEDTHLKSIDFARNRMSTSLEQIHTIGNNLNELIKKNQTILNLQQNTLALKTRPNLTGEELIRNTLIENEAYLTIVSGLTGACIGVLSGATVFSTNGSIGVAISPIFLVSIPVTIGAVTMSGLTFGAIKYIQSKLSSEINNNQLDEFYEKYSLFQENLNKLHDLPKYIENHEKNLLFAVNELDSLVKNHPNEQLSSKLSNGNQICENMKQLLQNFITC